MADLSPGAHNDNVNQVFSVLGVQGTLGTADTGGTAPTIPIGADPKTGAMFTIPITSGVAQNWDYLAVTYPSGSTEVYAYKVGGSAGTNAGTITITYTDSTKGSISTVIKT